MEYDRQYENTESSYYSWNAVFSFIGHSSAKESDFGSQFVNFAQMLLW